MGAMHPLNRNLFTLQPHKSPAYRRSRKCSCDDLSGRNSTEMGAKGLGWAGRRTASQSEAEPSSQPVSLPATMVMGDGGPWKHRESPSQQSLSSK